jgi:hypothetical protein
MHKKKGDVLCFFPSILTTQLLSKTGELRELEKVAPRTSEDAAEKFDEDAQPVPLVARVDFFASERHQDALRRREGPRRIRGRVAVSVQGPTLRNRGLLNVGDLEFTHGDGGRGHVQVETTWKRQITIRNKNSYTRLTDVNSPNQAKFYTLIQNEVHFLSERISSTMKFSFVEMNQNKNKVS